MKKIIPTTLSILYIAIETSFASTLDPAEEKYMRSLVKKNMESLVSSEQSIAGLSTKDREFALFTASTYLNEKLSNLTKTPVTADLDYQQRAYVMAIAVARLQLLAHLTGFPKSAECYNMESTGLLAISRGENATPINCRIKLYGPEVQGRYAAEARTPADSPVADLSNQWAASSTLNGIYSGILDKYGKNTPNPKPIERATENCKNEFSAIAKLPTLRYEATLVEATNLTLSWFVSFNEKKNLAPWEQKRSYITWSNSTALMGRNAKKSKRIEDILLGFSENTSDFIKRKKSFDQYTTTNEDLALRLEKIGKSIIQQDATLPLAVRKEGKILSDCIISSEGSSARKTMHRK